MLNNVFIEKKQKKLKIFKIVILITISVHERYFSHTKIPSLESLEVFQLFRNQSDT